MDQSVFFYCLLIRGFNNFNTEEIKKKGSLVISGKVLEKSVRL